MKLHQINYDYAIQIDKIWQDFWSDYTLPDDRARIIDAVAVSDNDKVIAYGQVRHFAEMMLFTDMNANHKDRIKALELLMAEGFRGVDRAGLTDVYCLIRDMKFARLIAKHFGFFIVDNPGVLLVKKLKE